jgi:hypothetical protein
MAESLYSRIRTFGTLAEIPAEVPDAVFALPSTINWMKAMAILVADCRLDFASGRAFRAIQPRSMPDRELNTVFEQLLFVLNQIATLKALTAVPNKADVARTGTASGWIWFRPMTRPPDVCKSSRARRSRFKELWCEPTRRPTCSRKAPRDILRVESHGWVWISE